MNKFRRLIEIAAAFFFGCVALITLAAAMSRTTLSVGLPDAYELACMAQGIAILWGIAIAVFDGKHVSVDLLYERLLATGRRWMDVVATVIIAIFLGFIAWMTITRALNSFSSGLTTNELRIMVGPFWLLASLGLVAAAFMAVARIAKLLQGKIT